MAGQQRRRGRREAVVFIAAAVIIGLTVDGPLGSSMSETAHASADERTSFATSGVDIDEMLARPLEPGVPVGYSEDLFALYSPGWGFDTDSISRTGIAANHRMPVTVSSSGATIPVGSATARPSQVTSESGEARVSRNLVTPDTAVSASYTSVWDQLSQVNDGVVSYGETPRNRWSNWASPLRTGEEWIVVELPQVPVISSVEALVYADSGDTQAPAALGVDVWTGAWTAVTSLSAMPASPASGENTLSFEPVTTARVRVRLTPQPGRAVSLTEIRVNEHAADSGRIPLRVAGRKYISDRNIASVVLDLSNTGEAPLDAAISASSPSAGNVDGVTRVGTGSGFQTVLGGEGFVPDSAAGIARSITLAPGASVRVRIGLAFGESRAAAVSDLESFFADADPGATQKRTFLAWFSDNVPYFDAPDPEFLRTYYFRWVTYRNHLRKTQDGSYIVSEFLPNVSWATKDNAIAAGAGHHLYEGRWVRDPKYLDDYETFWFSGVDQGPYSEWFADAYNARHEVLGNDQLLVDHDLLAALVSNFEDWENGSKDGTGLYSIADNPDAMENSISGFGPNYRPTINSYEYGDAVAIADIASRLGETAIAARFQATAAAIKQAVQGQLWDADDDFFKVRVKSTGQLAGVREQLGYIPWYFGLPDDDAEHASAWSQIMDPQGFFAPYGPTTAERRDPGFQQRTVNVDCEWNGPSWPFATSQTLTGMSRLLHDYHQDAVDRDDYFTLLKNYSSSQRRSGYPWIAEDLHADTGQWIADFPRSPNYNHSTFADLIITGLVGLQPSSGDELTIDPLLPAGTWDHFALENVSYHGHNVSVIWDADGSHYAQRTGLRLYLDGRLSASRAELGGLTADLRAPYAPTATATGGDGSARVDVEPGMPATPGRFEVAYGTSLQDLSSTTSMSGHSSEVRGLQNGMTYYFRARQLIDGAPSPWSIAVTAVPMAGAAPPIQGRDPGGSNTASASDPGSRLATTGLDGAAALGLAALMTSTGVALFIAGRRRAAIRG
ncbi:hypothetical protein GCM10027515_04580 [Schumannella luteola]|uniref:F5/8 type C domain-containing protein n=1 Tax=Schumannella luteola TaxID=472059 RepID=A0A852Y636_9MICO|nr:glycosyl hydrolase family 65 protein [Schumannella luteola]NYG98406.1 hypothetical protein [Schumannella luteola]TPX01356.1 hypothetical protein FJ656_28655 [Schumannella luteola]